MQFRLQDSFILMIEPEKFRPSRVRLIVKQMGKELVCRKEGINQLLEFLYGADEHLFKGRLQISKDQNMIQIFMKDEQIGTIQAADLKSALISVLQSNDAST